MRERLGQALEEPAWHQWTALWRGSWALHPSNRQVQNDRPVALCWVIGRTTCLRKFDGRWRVMHAHHSVPAE
jgi:hypothetical protein